MFMPCQNESPQQSSYRYKSHNKKLNIRETQGIKKGQQARELFKKTESGQRQGGIGVAETSRFHHMEQQ